MTTEQTPGELEQSPAWNRVQEQIAWYDAKSQLLIPNPLKRYLINSGMQHRLVQNVDGGFTIYVQKESPGGAKENNWLPAPDGSFYLVLRLYRPKPDAYNGRWQRPALQRTS